MKGGKNMDKINAGLVTIIGILLVLPLLGVDALGTVTTGFAGWAIAIAILIIGVLGLFKKAAV
jgi:hypothetical protein